MADSSQASYNAAFAALAERFRRDGWEARQEEPPQAYLHVSRPHWFDEKLSGIHFETYVLGGQLAAGSAPVCLHCEGDCPFQAAFLEKFTERARSLIETWPGYKILGPSGCSVCEVQVPLGATADATVVALEQELKRIQQVAPLVDEVIAEMTGKGGATSSFCDNVVCEERSGATTRISTEQAQ